MNNVASMESSLRNILHANEIDFEPQIRSHGHLPVSGNTNTATLEADNALPESKKRAATRIKSSYPRKRAIQACQKCRVRRTKCNNERPSCSSCLAIGAECTYTEGDHSRYVRCGISSVLYLIQRPLSLIRIALILRVSQSWTS